MKSSIYIVLVTAVLLSCDVERIPETQISDPSFWKSTNDLKGAANYLYTFLPRLPVLDDVMSDDAFSVGANDISSGRWLPPAQSTYFTEPYRLIRAANNIIEHGPDALAAGVSATAVDRYLAEARFFRAWAYFDLVRRYGGVPLILKTLPEDAPELRGPAAPREDVYQAIYEDLDFAAATLPTPTTLGSTDYGRVSNTAALAFKARVALFEGTRSKYHGYGDASQHLSMALEAAGAVMESGEHSLFSSYFNLFQPEGTGRQNRENIFVKQHGIDNSNVVVNYTTNVLGALTSGQVAITKALVDSYVMTDGLPTDQSPLYQEPESSVGVFENRDLRLNATVFKLGDPYIVLNGSQPNFPPPDLGFIRTGFQQRKFFNDLDYGPGRGSFIDLPLIRYAEVLLTFAEATYELSGSISDEDLNKSINLLRSRGGIAPLSNNFVQTNGLDMLSEIRRERRVELAQEGFRYWDLIRWKTAETELPKAVLGSYFFADEWATAVSVNLTPDNYIIAQSAEDRRFDPSKDYLWPFPVVELAMNPALEQNPNW